MKMNNYLENTKEVYQVEEESYEEYEDEISDNSDDETSEESEIDFEKLKYRQQEEEKIKIEEVFIPKKSTKSSKHDKFSLFDNSSKISSAITKNAKKNRLDYILGIEGFAKCLNNFSTLDYEFKEGEIIQVISKEKSLGRIFSSEKVFKFDNSMVEILEDVPEVNIPASWFFFNPNNSSWDLLTGKYETIEKKYLKFLSCGSPKSFNYKNCEVDFINMKITHKLLSEKKQKYQLSRSIQDLIFTSGDLVFVAKKILSFCDYFKNQIKLNENDININEELLKNKEIISSFQTDNEKVITQLCVILKNIEKSEENLLDTKSNLLDISPQRDLIVYLKSKKKLFFFNFLNI